MKVILILALFIALSSARPQGFKDASILRFENNNIGIGGYSFGFETSDGTKQAEVGEVVNEGKEDEHIVVQGRYSYIGDDGQTYEVEYTADENGYHPAGEHLPPSADVMKKKLGAPGPALASLAGGGLG